MTLPSAGEQQGQKGRGRRRGLHAEGSTLAGRRWGRGDSRRGGGGMEDESAAGGAAVDELKGEKKKETDEE